MLALVPLLVPAATAAATAAAMLILLMAIDKWWLPQQPESTTPRFHYFTRFVKWSKNKLTAAVRSARKRLASALSAAVAAHSHALIRALNNVTELVLRAAGTFADEAEQTYRALYALRHVTMPAEIQAALRPVIQTANTATALARAATTTLTEVSVEIANGLRALPWGVPDGLPPRVRALMVTYKRLWDKVWDELGPRVTELWTQIVPELRERIEALERGAGGGIGQGLQAIRNRLEALEAWRANTVMPRLNALQQAVDLLSDEVFGPIAGGLTALLERIVELERQVAEVIPQEVARLDGLIAELRLDLEKGIRTGLEVFRDRIEALELEVFTAIGQRIEAMQLAIDALAAVVFEEVGVGLSTLTQRIVELEAYVFGELRERIDLVVGRIEALEADIRDNLLPRLRAIEQLLVPAALAALVLQALRIAAPNLFCRNVTNATRALCADDEAFWDALLAGAVIFAIALNPREVAAAGQALTGALSGVIAETVDH